MRATPKPAAYYKQLASALQAAGYPEVQDDDYAIMDAILAAANAVLEIRSMCQE